MDDMKGEIDIIIHDDSTPEELINELDRLHKKFTLTDTSFLLEFLESEERYELCKVVKDWSDENI